ncbi:hypothetical protein [Paenarthrobacter sp. NPDC058040]
MDEFRSDFITKAAMDEVCRREPLYSEGSAFPGATRNLAPGRNVAP